MKPTIPKRAVPVSKPAQLYAFTVVMIHVALLKKLENGKNSNRDHGVAAQHLSAQCAGHKMRCDPDVIVLLSSHVERESR